MKIKQPITGNRIDLSAQKVTESLALLYSIIESPKNIVIFALDRKYCYTAFNNKHKQLMQKIQGAEIKLGMNMLEIIKDPNDKKKAKKNFDRVLSGKSFTLVEEYGKRPERFYDENVYRPVVDNTGRVTGLTVFLTDITAKKKTEAELNCYRTRDLAQSQEHLAVTLRSIGDAVIATDVRGRITLMNPVAEGLTGWKEAESINKPLAEVFQVLNEETRQPVENPVARVLREGVVAGLANHTLLIARDGTERPIADSGAPIRDAQGDVNGVVLIFRNQTEERAAQKTLQESEERYRKLFDSAVDGLFVIDMQGNYIDVNPAACKMLGYTRDELLGMDVFQVGERGQGLSSQERGQLLEQYRSTWRQGISGYESRLVTKSGVLIPIEMSITPLTFHGQEAALGAVRDITARVRAEEDLKRSEEKFRTAFTTSPDSININRLSDGVYVEINQGFSQIMGFTEEDVLGKSSLELDIWVNPEDRAKLAQDLRAQGLVENLEAKFRTKDGRIKAGLMSAAVIDIEGVPYILSITRDITARVQAENELRLREQQLRLIYDSIGDILYDLRVEPGPRYRFLTVNSAFLKATGLTRKQVVGKTISEVIPEPSLQLVRSNYVKAIQEKRIVYWEETSPYPAGLKTGIVSIAPVFDEEGNCTHLVGSVHDITERKHAEEYILHLQSVLMSIRNINQLIVHEKNRKRLLQRACDNLAETSDYILVWIGLIEEDTKNVLPVGHAGFEEGYLKSIKVTWDDSETGNGPTGTAIKTKKPFVMRDIAADSRFAPWREEAMKRGYASSTAVPLIYGERIFGVLNVYATNPDGFDEEEVDLLLEVSQDIAFAMYNIEIEEEIVRTKEFLQNVIDNTSDLICTIDLEGNFLSVNRALIEKTGYEEKELIGKPHMMPAVEPELFSSTFKEVLEKGSLSNIEVPIRKKDGTTADILYSATLLNDTNNEPVAVAGFGKDITERKRMENILKENELRLKAAIEASGAGIYSHSVPIGPELYHSERWAEILGYKLSELPSYKKFLDWLFNKVHPDDLSLLNREYSDFIEGRKPKYHTIVRLRHKSGKWVYVEGLSNAIERDKSGKVTRIIGIMLDITERKQAEIALKDSEARLSTLLSNLPGMAYQCKNDKHWTMLFVNDACEQLTGYKPDQLIYNKDISYNELIYPDDRKFVKRHVEEALNKGAHFELEYRIISADGKEKWVWERGVQAASHDNGPKLLEGVIHDITGRKRAEEELQRRVKELTTIYNAARKLQHPHTPDTLAQELIAIMEQNLFYEYGAVLSIDESSGTLIPFALSDQGRGSEYIEEDKNYILSQRVTVGQGITGWVAETGQTVRLGDVRSDSRYFALRKGIRSELCVPLQAENRIIGVLNVETTKPKAYTESDQRVLETLASQIALAIQQSYLHERIERHAAELEQRVEQRTMELQAANKELETFAYSVSHDLRAPLRAINGFAQIISRRHRARLNAEGRHYFDNILEASTHMGQLIEDLLKYSKLGRKAVALVPTPLAGILELTMDTLSERIAETGARLDLTADLPAVLGDRTLLLQIFTNLLDNALLYHKPEKSPQIKITPKIEENQVIIRFSDKGLGIAPEYHDKIFEIFQRLHDQAEYPGTGIGLAIVKKAVELQRGTLWVESTPGKGSTFNVKLDLGNDAK